MKNFLFIVGFFSILMYSCKDDTESLKNEIDNLKHIITLQNAFVAKKIIVSVSSTTIQKINYWNITFSDNMMIQ
ncbi:MAG: hypothetical protein LBE79_09725, partial [Tannerella sp.]|nr:hypothetical protein [Tannerella sp.]